MCRTNMFPDSPFTTNAPLVKTEASKYHPLFWQLWFYFCVFQNKCTEIITDLRGRPVSLCIDSSLETWVALERECVLGWYYFPVWKRPSCNRSVSNILMSWHNGWFHLERDAIYATHHCIHYKYLLGQFEILDLFTKINFIIFTW